MGMDDLLAVTVTVAAARGEGAYCTWQTVLATAAEKAVLMVFMLTVRLYKPPMAKDLRTMNSPTGTRLGLSLIHL